MTKPEGPAQEPHPDWCKERHPETGEQCVIRIPGHTKHLPRFGAWAECDSWDTESVPATSAPSQPAGALVDAIMQELVAKKLQYGSPHQLEDIRTIIAQQTAAKDADDEQVLKERDRAEDVVTDAAIALGCKEEWSNLHSHFACVPELIGQLKSAKQAAQRERDSLREANARLAADLDAALKAGKAGKDGQQ